MVCLFTFQSQFYFSQFLFIYFRLFVQQKHNFQEGQVQFRNLNNSPSSYSQVLSQNLKMQQNKANIQSKTLWIGDLQPWMDEASLSALISGLGYAVQSTKLVRDKQSNAPPKYGFVQFKIKQHALNFYQSYNGMPIPNYVHKNFKLNWSTYGTTKTSQINSLKPLSQIQVYVGDLPLNLTDHKLLQFFKQRYPSAFMSKIITDPVTKASKGYGFVKFTNLEQANKSLVQMNGQAIGDKVIKVSQAHQKQKQQAQQAQQQNQSEAARRIKIYENFYSMMDDPLLKSEYERQALKTFQQSDSRQGSFKQKLQHIRSLSYKQTQNSQSFLNHLPKMLAFKSKFQVQQKMYY